MIGPVYLDPLASLPHMEVEEKKAYLGKRQVAAGGKFEMNLASDSGTEEGENEGTSEMPSTSKGKVPLSYHCLPLNLLTDLIVAYCGKHVLDYTPHPMNLAAELVIKGISYFGVCGTDVQRRYLDNGMHNRIMKELLDANSPMGDHRYISRVRQL